MGALSTLTKSLSHHCIKTSKTHLQKPLLNLSNFENFNNATDSQYHHYQSRRTLILDSVSSESVKLNRLSDSDSGIVEVNLNRPGARNAIGKDLLRGLKDSFEVISKDSTANVVLITSSVPKVFCAGADLKVFM
ncbi:hypothetical protein LWI29_021099 [Acer saccharum]|uniref:Uncharacterized protein n=1 Tax=Acer saccharum TaxID=4024 RepID=A0AA39W1L5_ACESA|nr:hypothetical protein LWI29_021099 [Acer saccharum]